MNEATLGADGKPLGTNFGTICQKALVDYSKASGLVAAVEHPAHYNQGGIETIDAIEAWGLDFHLGCVVKYISRAGKKDPAKKQEDLMKARWYLERAISRCK